MRQTTLSPCGKHVYVRAAPASRRREAGGLRGAPCPLCRDVVQAVPPNHRLVDVLLGLCTPRMESPWPHDQGDLESAPVVQQPVLETGLIRRIQCRLDRDEQSEEPAAGPWLHLDLHQVCLSQKVCALQHTRSHIEYKQHQQLPPSTHARSDHAPQRSAGRAPNLKSQIAWERTPATSLRTTWLMKMGGGVGNPTSLMKGNVGLATPPHQVWVTAKRGHGVGNPRWGWLPQGLGPFM